MSATSPKRILITGGAGFLGSHLCEHLLACGAQVICLDDFSTGAFDNVAQLVGHPRFDLVVHDVTEPIELEVDEIYNLACPASPRLYQRDPVRTTMTCVLGARNLLDLAARTGARILQASTSEVYGDPTVHPQPESYRGVVNPIGPRACYDEGKRCAETLFFDYHRHHGVAVKVARIFNTYGPRMLFDDGRIVSNFVVQGLRGEPLTVYGDGSQTRAFCYVSDMVAGLVRLMATEARVTGPVNLGNPGARTVSAMAGLIAAMTGGRSTVTYRRLPDDDPRQREPDIGLARRLLSWSPQVPLKEGLRRTIEDFRLRLAAQETSGRPARTRVAASPLLERGAA